MEDCDLLLLDCYGGLRFIRTLPAPMLQLGKLQPALLAQARNELAVAQARLLQLRLLLRDGKRTTNFAEVLSLV